jgi:hypothetical protein
MTIEEQAREVAELKRQASDALAAGKIEEWLEIICQRTNAVERLQNALLERSVVVAKDPEAARILREIDLTEIEHLDTLGRRLLYSWFSDRDYALGLSRVNTLISPITIPPELRAFVEEARQCYALSQSNAVYSLSRTILEAAVNDLCVRTRRMPKYIVDEALFDDERYSFRNRLKLLADGPRTSRICDHYKLLCRVVHGSVTVSCGEALAGLLETLGFVHYLYAINQHGIQGGA